MAQDCLGKETGEIHSRPRARRFPLAVLDSIKAYVSTEKRYMVRLKEDS
jgi:hypothetical protein